MLARESDPGLGVDICDSTQIDPFAEMFQPPLPAPVASALDVPIAVTSFPTIGAKRKSERQLSLRELAAEIGAATADSKDNLPWFKLARFGDLRSEKNCLRNDVNVLSVTGLEADYDREEMSLAEAARRLRDAGVVAMLYTTAQHTEAAPRWRAFCASKPQPAQVPPL